MNYLFEFCSEDIIAKKKKTVNNGKIILTLTVSQDEFEKGIQKAYEKVVNDINVPGVRKGKASRKAIEQCYGKNFLYEVAVQFIFQKPFEATIKEQGIEVIDRPLILLQSISVKNGLATFDVEVSIKPDVVLGQYKGIEIKEKLSNNEMNTDLQETVVEEIAKNAEVNIPDSMICEKLESLVHDVDFKLKKKDLDLERYLQLIGMTINEFKEQFRDEAKKQVKHELVLEAIAKEENINASDEDVKNELKKLAETFDTSIETIESFISIGIIKKDICLRKAKELVFASANII